MAVPGQRIKRTRWIEAEPLAVAVEVELVYPDEDPSEPCYEPETIERLREIQEHVAKGDVSWLTAQGKDCRVYHKVA